jgi:hypothetical protein
VRISKWSATQFSLTFSESTGAVCTEDSLCHRRKQFRGLVFDWTATQFSLTVYESTGAVCADESTGHLWKHIR